MVGGAGFLGSHLVDYLIEERGCDVLVIDNLVAGRREFVHPKARLEHCDITKSEYRMKNLFAAHKSKFVFNYAAQPYVPLSFARPLHVFETNATGAMQVINAAQESGCCEAILQVSSAEIYGEVYGDKPDAGINRNGETDKINEKDSIDPHSTYGVAKMAVDAYVQTAWRERQTPCIALRQFNCAGARETHPYIVPEIIGQLDKYRMNDREYLYATSDGAPVVKLGSNTYRDFLWAGDAVRLAVRLLECGQFGEVYNLGSETGIKMYDLAVMIGKLMGFAEVRVEPDPDRVRPWEIWHLQSCNDKLRAAIGPDETPLTTLEDALRKAIDWYVGNGRIWPWERQL